MASNDSGVNKALMAELFKLLAAEQGSDLVRLFGSGGRFPAEPPAIRLPKPLAKRQAYTLRVDLLHIKPPIWRRLVVASDLTMDQFHAVIQAAFGWENAHLHSFELLSPGYDRYMDRLLTRYDVEEEGEEGLAEYDVQLCQVLVKPGDKVGYTYDFGDDWRHSIKLEKVTDWNPDAPLAECVKGRRARPPEDCGGVYGYWRIVDKASEQDGDEYQSDDQDEEEYEDDWDWTPADFDPEAFDLDRINARLSREAEAGFVRDMPF